MSDRHGDLGKPSARRCQTPGRQRPGSTRRHKPLQRHARSACSQRRRLADPDHEAFVEWFVAYWRRRGSDLFVDPSVTEEASTNA
jgi:hypothetical protein